MTTKIENLWLEEKSFQHLSSLYTKVDRPKGQRNVIYEWKINIKCIMDNVSWSNELGAKPTYIPKYR
jgi:hypothetical protein